MAGRSEVSYQLAVNDKFINDPAFNDKSLNDKALNAKTANHYSLSKPRILFGVFFILKIEHKDDIFWCNGQNSC